MKMLINFLSNEVLMPVPDLADSKFLCKCILFVLISLEESQGL
jgi:hypothetical protein